jgi:hypothetical protein
MFNRIIEGYISVREIQRQMKGNKREREREREESKESSSFY